MANGRITKWIAFDCPCTERHRVILNLNTKIRPSWTVGSSTPLTISPSIDELRGDKRCHYLIKDGHIDWI
ncbi:DUF6527 family protein [Streptomyces sp. NPDC057939]|uniref:DUF6527 family protein n=1 Tax=Streptomyces sp. NPDC057939 TaxID=3346284 RepID=UPI0036EF8723